MGICVKLDKYLSFQPIYSLTSFYLVLGTLVDMKEGKDKTARVKLTT